MRSRSIFVTLAVPGSAGQTKTPTGCCANIFRVAPICPCIARPSSVPSRGSSTKGRERPCSTSPQLRSLQNVLQRSVEPAAIIGPSQRSVLGPSETCSRRPREPAICDNVTLAIECQENTFTAWKNSRMTKRSVRARTRLPLWGGRIRTSVRWNQNPAPSSMISTNFLTKQRIPPPR
jgi:hypothetical protein